MRSIIDEVESYEVVPLQSSDQSFLGQEVLMLRQALEEKDIFENIIETLVAAQRMKKFIQTPRKRYAGFAVCCSSMSERCTAVGLAGLALINLLFNRKLTQKAIKDRHLRARTSKGKRKASPLSSWQAEYQR